MVTNQLFWKLVREFGSSQQTWLLKIALFLKIFWLTVEVDVDVEAAVEAAVKAIVDSASAIIK